MRGSQLPCYVCVHCGKCPVGQLKAVISCANCGQELGPGLTECPNCGIDLKGNMRVQPPAIGFSIDDENAFIAKLGRKRES